MSLQKSTVIRGGNDTRTDERAYFQQLLLNMDIEEVCNTYMHILHGYSYYIHEYIYNFELTLSLYSTLLFLYNRARCSSILACSLFMT